MYKLQNIEHKGYFAKSGKCNNKTITTPILPPNATKHSYCSPLLTKKRQKRSKKLTINLGLGEGDHKNEGDADTLDVFDSDNKKINNKNNNKDLE